MPTDTLISSIQEILTISQEMAGLAASEKWPELEVLTKNREALLEAFSKHTISQNCAQQVKDTTLEIMQIDKNISTILESQQQHTREQLLASRKNNKAMDHYKA